MIRTRRARLLAGLLLLALVWPPMAGIALATTGWLAAHFALVGTAAAVVLVAGAVPGPVDRVLTRLLPRATPERRA